MLQWLPWVVGSSRNYMQKCSCSIPQFSLQSTSPWLLVATSPWGTRWQTTLCWPCPMGGSGWWWRLCCFSTLSQLTPSSLILLHSSLNRCLIFLQVKTSFSFLPNIFNSTEEFNWKRCVFRSLSVACLLFIAETVPSFGAILDLIGASTVTLLTFIFPPYFYMRLADASLDKKEWLDR